jgi:hypothetical protein
VGGRADEGQLPGGQWACLAPMVRRALAVRAQGRTPAAASRPPAALQLPAGPRGAPPAACRLLVFLREEEERERQAEIERLKPIGTPVGPYLEYRCKVRWRVLHAACCVQGQAGPERGCRPAVCRRAGFLRAAGAEWAGGARRARRCGGRLQAVDQERSQHHAGGRTHT